MNQIATSSFRKFISDCLVSYNPINEFSSKITKFLSFFYNIFFSLASFVLALVPIIFSIATAKVMKEHELGIFLLVNLILFVMLFFDWILFISVCNIYYNSNTFKKILPKLLFNFPRLFQCGFSIATFILYPIFITASKDYIFVLKNIDQNIFQILLFIFLFLNVVTIFPRYFANVINAKKKNIFKTLFFKKIYAFIYSFAALIIFTFIFAYIIFLTQVNSPLFDDSGEKVNWNYWTSLWFCFVTITTIGYGDIVVDTSIGRVFTIILSIVGIIVYGSISALFISIYNDYNQTKDEMRRTAKKSREKHLEHEILLNEMNKIFILNLYKAKLITKKTYLSLLNDHHDIDEIITNDSIFAKLKIKNNSLYFDDKKMGKIVNNTTPHHMAVFSKPENSKNVKLLKNEYISFVNKSLKSKSSIYFSADLVEDINVKNIVIYTKKPHRLAYLEYKIACSFVMDKTDAWEKYGQFSDFDKMEYFDKFVSKDDVRVFVILEKNVYESPVLLESFGIYSNSKVKDIIYLV